MSYKQKIIRGINLVLALITLVFSQTTIRVLALSADQTQAFQEGILYFNTEASTDCSDSSTDATSLTGNDNEEKIFNYFTGKGLSAIAAAGIVGNFGQESHWNPDDGGGYLGQWGGGRLTNLETLAAQEGKPVTDLGVQLDFVWQELNGSYPTVLANVKAAATVSDATIQFMGPDPDPQPGEPNEVSGGYENPGDPQTQNRIDYANAAFQLYGGAAATGAAGAEATTTSSSADGCEASSSGPVDCTTATGNAKILCEAKAYNGVYYRYGAGHGSYSSFIASCPDPSNPPDNQPTGAPVSADGFSGNPSSCATDCSGLVDIAVQAAFGTNLNGAAVPTFESDTADWQKLPSIESTQAGDIVTVGTDHVEIVDHYDASSGLLYTFGSHATGQKTSEISSTPAYWTGGAYRYIGPGSSAN
jgi:hypothetical protein